MRKDPRIKTPFKIFVQAALLFTMAGISIRSFAQIEIEGVNINTLRNPFESQLPRIQEPTPSQETPEPDRFRVSPISERVGRPSEEMTLPSYRVTGMIWKSERPQAIIDGNVVDIGDQLSDSGAVIRSISKESVELEYNNQTYTIKP